MNTPYISICIPAYKRVAYLKRLLDSISVQTYTNYEVIITDDSPTENVLDFIKNYKSIQTIFYFKNSFNAGTPENWNESISKAKGNWIKLMHDDDWFASPDSLQLFYNATLSSNNCPFIFCAYNNVLENSEKKTAKLLNPIEKFLLNQSPLNLFKKQF